MISTHGVLSAVPGAQANARTPLPSHTKPAHDLCKQKIQHEPTQTLLLNLATPRRLAPRMMMKMIMKMMFLGFGDGIDENLRLCLKLGFWTHMLLSCKRANTQQLLRASACTLLRYEVPCGCVHCPSKLQNYQYRRVKMIAKRSTAPGRVLKPVLEQICDLNPSKP